MQVNIQSAEKLMQVFTQLVDLAKSESVEGVKDSDQQTTKLSARDRAQQLFDVKLDNRTLLANLTRTISNLAEDELDSINSLLATINSLITTDLKEREKTTARNEIINALKNIERIEVTSPYSGGLTSEDLEDSCIGANIQIQTSDNQKISFELDIKSSDGTWTRESLNLSQLSKQIGFAWHAIFENKLVIKLDSNDNEELNKLLHDNEILDLIWQQIIEPVLRAETS